MLVNGQEMSWEQFVEHQKRGAPRNPLKLSDERLAELDEKYPREGVHKNEEHAEMLDAIKQFERFEKRVLSEEERALFRFAWQDRGQRDYLEVVNRGGAHRGAMAAILSVGNRQHVSNGQGNGHLRPFGMANLNP